jgi:hypothetical protein
VAESHRITTMPPLAGDALTAALIPLAEDLVAAVHALKSTVVADILDHAAALAGDHLAGARSLAVLCAGMASEDHGVTASLGWTLDPAGYQRRRGREAALLASLHAGRDADRAAPAALLQAGVA